MLSKLVPAVSTREDQEMIGECIKVLVGLSVVVDFVASVPSAGNAQGLERYSSMSLDF